MIAVWTVVSFLSGACMFSYWLGRLARANLHTVGDGNPGAVNLWMARGYRLGLAGVALDFLKGYVPVLLFMERGGAPEAALFALVALAPMLGHAFSPFLGFRGGKAIAVTFGVWSAATGFEVALAYAVLLAVLLLLGKALNRGRSVSAAASASQVVGGMFLLVVFLVARGYPGPLLALWLGSLLLLAYTHRRELREFVVRKTRS